jgi:hypothetical protein
MRHDRAEIQSCKQCGKSFREASMKRVVTVALSAGEEIRHRNLRHCERSEAIHSAAKKVWIASSLRSSQ